jgi:DNA-binding MarR family transcriptional regulator
VGDVSLHRRYGDRVPPTPSAGDGPDELRLAAWRAFLHAGVALTGVLEGELEEGEQLPLSWYDVLLKLHEAGGELRMQELASAVLLSKSGLTRLVDRMERDGLVDRQPCASDRRGWLAVLTPQGEARLRKAAPVHLQGIERHFGRLVDEREARTIRDVCERLLAHVAQLGCGPADDRAGG